MPVYPSYRMPVIKRTSLNLHVDLVAEARDILETRGTTDTIHRALEEVVRRERLRRLSEERFELSEDERLQAWRD